MNLTARFSLALLLTVTLALAACGFHMRGLTELSFETLYIEQSGANSIEKELKRNLTTNGVKIVGTPEQAELQVNLMGESTQKRILSLSGSGKVREYELLYRVSFRVKETASPTWGEVQTVETRRDYTYDDSLLLAKEGEEARLYNDMRSDASREIMRRLSVLKSGKSSTR